MKQQTKDATPSPSIPETFTLKQDGETLVFEGNSTSCMNDYVSSKEPDETETFFDWCKNSYPYSSIPVKEGEVLDITKGTWYFEEHSKQSEYVGNITSDLGHPNIRTIACLLDYAGREESIANAKAICTAVNSTYGKNLNPAAMEELYKALTALQNICGIIPREVFTETGQRDFQAILDASATALQNAKTIKP